MPTACPPIRRPVISYVFRPYIYGLLAIWLASPVPSEAQSTALPFKDLEPILRDAVAANGEAGLLDTLDLLLSTRPSLVNDGPSAAALTVLAVQLLLAKTPGMRPDFGAIASRIVAAAKPEARGDISYAVTNSVASMLAPAESNSAAATQETQKMADTGAVTRTNENPKDAEQEKTTRQPQPLRAGDFLFYPDAMISGVYDSNIFATRNNTIDDFITVGSPNIEVESAWPRHYLDLKAGAEIGRYKDHGGEDYEDYWASTDARLDLWGQSNIFGGISYDRLHESRESPDDINGIDPTTYHIFGAYAGTVQQFGRFGVRIGGTYQQIDYNPVATSQDIVSNDDRDRKIYTGGVRLDMKMASGFSLYGQAAADVRRYNLDPPIALYDRDSKGGRYIGGVTFSLTDKVKGDIFAGHLDQKYDDSALENVSAAAFGGSLSYAPNRRSTLTLFTDRSVVETTLEGASAFLSTSAGLNLEQVVADRTWLRSSIAYSHANYQGIDRSDNVVNAETSLQYYFNPYLFVEAAYRFRHLHSTSVIEDYNRHQLILRLGGQLYAADIDTPGGVSVAEGAQVFSGGYAGLNVGYGAFGSAVSGPRGATNTTTFSDYGGKGASWGVHGGYGVVFDRLYFGFELEGETSGAAWTFDRGEDIREISVRKRLAYGIGGRAGYVIGDAALLYGRIGAMRAEFITRYVLGTTLIDTDFTRSGLRLGGGAEIILTPRLWFRLDYAYTNYHSYAVDYDSGIDVFDNDENLFRVGMSYRL